MYLLPAFLASALYSFTSGKYLSILPCVFGLWCVGVPLYLLHIVSLLYIRQWHVQRSSLLPHEHQAKCSRAHWREAFYTTYQLWGNPQLLGTSSNPSENTPRPKSRLAFFRCRLIKLSIYYLSYTYLIPWLVDQIVGDFASDDFTPVKQTIIRRLYQVTSRELMIRGYTATIWIVESVIFLDSSNAVLGCFFVLMGLDRPNDWPTLFGSLISATSLRRFWSKFWHKLAVKPYGTYGALVAQGLGLQKDSAEHKAIVAFVIFALSGLTHSAASWQLGHIEWQQDFYWFCLNFLGCWLEILCYSSASRITKHLRCSQKMQGTKGVWLGKIIGYVWVFGFFFWSTPKWKYPSMYQRAQGLEAWDSFLSSIEIVPQ